MPPSGDSQSSDLLSRGGPRIAERGPAQYLPSEHADMQYEGHFKGLGVTSKEPVVSKRSNQLAKLHMATHFAIGCKKWEDEQARQDSTSHAVYTDPEVVYATRDCPDKNASIVELRQREHNPDAHYRTEQRERFEHPGNQPREVSFPLGKSKVHFGDDAPELVTATASAHHRPADTEGLRAAAFRSAGLGALHHNTPWPHQPRVNPITAGPRAVDNHDYGVEAGNQFGKYSSNRSHIVMEHNVRNPVLGYHVPAQTYKKAHMVTTLQLIDDGNDRVPHLRSLAALRPHDDY